MQVRLPYIDKANMNLTGTLAAPMINQKLPVRLGKEPIIEVICAVNFTSDLPAESLLPGLLISKLNNSNTKIEPLGASQLPQAVRDSDPNLQNAPLMKIGLDDQHYILIASKWIAVGCQAPYSGWINYKKIIQSVFCILAEAVFIKTIERYSLKYVDFIRTCDSKQSLSMFNVKIEMAGRQIASGQTQIRTEIHESGLLHILSLVSQAKLERADELPVEGVLVDVDSIKVESLTISSFIESLSDRLDEIHGANKEIFFDLLSSDGLEKLEPVYA